MLEAKELRIGNLVNYRITDKLDERKEWLEISEIDSDDLGWLSNNGFKDDDYQPIELTEEWLVRLPEDLVSEDIPSWIKFVHHLQNWYWAENYCKKELIFK